MISLLVAPTGTQRTTCAKGGKQKICLPEDYQKYDLPETNEGPTVVVVGVDIKDIPKVEDKDFSITINAYFMVKWRDTRLELIPLDDNGNVEKLNKIKVNLTIIFYVTCRSCLNTKGILTLSGPDQSPPPA